MVLGLFAILLVYAAASAAAADRADDDPEGPHLLLPLRHHRALLARAAPRARRLRAARRFFALFSGYHAEETISEIVLAVTSLSARRVGALIVLERREGLQDLHRERIAPSTPSSPTSCSSRCSRPGTPLHDGAVIVSGDRIAAAASFLPLSLKEGLPKRFGTRHRAAIGITEETDALAILVSEERGTISLSRGGELQEDLDASRCGVLQCGSLPQDSGRFIQEQRTDLRGRIHDGDSRLPDSVLS